MVAGSQVIVGFFKNTSEELIIEYHELHAIQEFKMSLGKILAIVNSHGMSNKDEFESQLKTYINDANNNLNICKEVITKKHKPEFLEGFEIMIKSVENTSNQLYISDIESDPLVIKQSIFEIDQKIKESIGKVDLLINETKVEIEEYEERNQTVIRHGTFTVVTVGIILILLLAIGGMIFIRNLTNPIRELVKATVQLGKGDRQTKVKVNSNDEFLTLANSFNTMVEALDETMVSKDHLNNILENMFDPLLVTDENGIIRSVNIPTLKLLGYKDSDLIGRPIELLFNKNNNGNESVPKPINHQKFINQQDSFISKEGKSIPALIACTYLKNQKNEIDGLIILGHDLTEKKAFEKKIEQSRKEQQIAINEAQEDERMRIATDLHDGLGQMLSAISFSIQDINRDNDQSDESIVKIQNQIDAAIREAKNISHNLIPIVLKDFGLVAAIDNMVDKANELYTTKFRFNSYDFTDRVDPKIEKAIYRICQESLTNIVKHAQAKNANIQLFRAQGFVVLVIDDDGVGFDMNLYESGSIKTGIGLISIKDRVDSFDGTFSMDSQIDKGTELIIEIPCRKKNTDGNS